MLLKIGEADWAQVKRAFNDLSVPLAAHQGIANILSAIENQCKVEENAEPIQNISKSDSKDL